jgi:hypothetical protein
MEPLKFVTQIAASHISGMAHLPVLMLSFPSLIGVQSRVGDRSAILVYAYLMLKASLLINAGFRRSRIVNIDG